MIAHQIHLVCQWSELSQKSTENQKKYIEMTYTENGDKMVLYSLGKHADLSPFEGERSFVTVDSTPEHLF